MNDDAVMKGDKFLADVERAFLHTFGDDPAGWCEHALIRTRGLREYGPDGMGENWVPICNRIEDLLTHIASYFDPNGTHVVISRQFMNHLEREAGFDPDA